MVTSKPYFFIVAGEASGDAIAASLVQEVRQADAKSRFVGIAGPKMRAAGVQSLFEAEGLACMGIVEVVRHIGSVWRVYRLVKRALRSERPEALILVDYAGLNLKLARYAKSLNIPVFYYVPPKVWAWKKYRLKTMRDCVGFVASVLPFEKTIYQDAGIPVAYVGHPLLRGLPTPGPVMPATRPGIQAKRIVLLPGSRRREVATTLPVMLQVVEQLQHQGSNFECVLLQAAGLPDSVYDPYLQDASIGVKRLRDQSMGDLPPVDLALAASGTVTLELGVLGIPTVVMYQLSWLSFALFRTVSSIRFASLVNLILDQAVFPEFLQGRMTAQQIVPVVKELLNEGQCRMVMRERLNDLASLMNSQDQSPAAALLGFMKQAGGANRQGHSAHQA